MYMKIIIIVTLSTVKHDVLNDNYVHVHLI